MRKTDLESVLDGSSPTDLVDILSCNAGVYDIEVKKVLNALYDYMRSNEIEALTVQLPYKPPTSMRAATHANIVPKIEDDRRELPQPMMPLPRLDNCLTLKQGIDNLLEQNLPIYRNLAWEITHRLPQMGLSRIDDSTAKAAVHVISEWMQRDGFVATTPADRQSLGETVGEMCDAFVQYNDELDNEDKIQLIKAIICAAWDDERGD